MYHRGFYAPLGRLGSLRGHCCDLMQTDLESNPWNVYLNSKLLYQTNKDSTISITEVVVGPGSLLKVSPSQTPG